MTNLNNQEIQRTVGIEIEFYSPRSRTTIENAFVEAGISFRNATHYQTRRCQNWTLKTDGSLNYPPSIEQFPVACTDNNNRTERMPRGWEMVSPVMDFNETTLAQIEAVCETLVSNKIEARVNRSTGLHIHISNDDLTFKQNKLIAKRYAKFEDVFDYFMPRSRRTNSAGYCRSLICNSRGTSVEIINQTIQKINSCRSIQCVQRLFGSGNRYAKLNFTSPHGTVEFRHHSGTIDSVKINNWLKLCHQIVVASKNNKPVKKLDATRTGTRTLNHRFKVLMSGINITSDVKKFFGKRMRKFIREDGQPQTVQNNVSTPIDPININTEEQARAIARRTQGGQ